MPDDNFSRPAKKQLSLAMNEKQARILIRQFDKKFPHERDCVEELYRRIQKEQHLKCFNCRNKIKKEYGKRMTKCEHCHKEIWFTAGTFFNRIKLARPWLIAFWLIERGLLLSSSGFHRLIGIAQSTALNIFKKIMTVVQQTMSEDSLPVSSSEFSPIYCKRSYETQARNHPRTEEETKEEEEEEDGDNDENGDEDNRDRKNKNIISLNTDNIDATQQLSEFERKVYALLSTESVPFEKLVFITKASVGTVSAAITMLELNGLVTRMAGDRYILNNKRTDSRNKSKSEFSLLPHAHKVVSANINFIRLYFHGISRKYIQNYLAAVYCAYKTTQGQNQSLFNKCLQFGPLQYHQLFNYVSPSIVSAYTKHL
ncbi:MAG: hypothetical protein K2W82_18955 [Candidatus Obscuribacterales bacterium]|nr:hypothetical protein [Candidatus Obscuribacterales bacterium]